MRGIMLADTERNAGGLLRRIRRFNPSAHRRALLDLGTSAVEPDVYHASKEGICTWFDFARTILNMAGFAGVTLDPISSTKLDRRASRPARSALDCVRLTAERG
jgi:dTDP-4-dehydrorhamnose reductase